MGVFLLSRPIVNGCNFNAAGNPILYKFRREDNQVSQVNNNGGFAQIQINGVDVTAYYEVGDSVVVMNGYSTLASDNRTITGVVTASALSGGNTRVTIDVAFSEFSTFASDSINNLSKRTDYKLFVECFRSSDNESLSDDVAISYSPFQDGIINVNVSSIVKSFISAEWENPSGVNQINEDASIKFYIKYQEYYDSGLISSPTSDSANPIIAVFAAMQVGSDNGGNMLSFFPSDYTKRWLTKFSLPSGNAGIGVGIKKLSYWKGSPGWPFTLCFIWPSSISGFYRYIEEFDGEGNLINASVDALTSNPDAVNRLKLPYTNLAPISDQVKYFKLALRSSATPAFTSFITALSFNTAVWIQDTTPGTGDPWIMNEVTAELAGLGGGAISRRLYVNNTSIPVATGRTFKLVTDVTHPLTHDINIYLLGYDANVGWEILATLNNAVGTGSPVTRTLTGSLITDVRSYTRYAIRVFSNNAVAGYIVFHNAFIQFSERTLLLEELTIDVKDVCDYDADYLEMPEQNPIHLFWINSMGGDAHWNFEKVHEYSYNYSDGKKAKRIILYATGLHPVQWEAINELNTIGELYQTNIVELTSDIVATSKRVGQQVYMLRTGGTRKTGVIVIPQSESVKSRANKQSISIEIELPEIFGME